MLWRDGWLLRTFKMDIARINSFGSIGVAMCLNSLDAHQLSNTSGIVAPLLLQGR